MTDFCGIPLASLRENSITELNLDLRRIPQGVGVPGAIVLSKLLPSATALTLLKCASPPALAFTSPPSDTLLLPLARSLNGNQLCGVFWQNGYGFRGTFTAKGITALSEGIKQCKTLVSLR